jgi:hypothetical protein
MAPNRNACMRNTRRVAGQMAVAPVCEHTFVTTPSELLSHLRVIEHMLENLDPASIPIDEVIEMFFDLAELQHVCASAKNMLEQIDPAVAERAQAADA